MKIFMICLFVFGTSLSVQGVSFADADFLGDPTEPTIAETSNITVDTQQTPVASGSLTDYMAGPLSAPTGNVVSQEEGDDAEPDESADEEVHPWLLDNNSIVSLMNGIVDEVDYLKEKRKKMEDMLTRAWQELSNMEPKVEAARKAYMAAYDQWTVANDNLLACLDKESTDCGKERDAAAIASAETDKLHAIAEDMREESMMQLNKIRKLQDVISEINDEISDLQSEWRWLNSLLV